MQQELQRLIDIAINRIDKTCDNCNNQMDINRHKHYLYQGSIVKNIPYLYCHHCNINKDINPVFFAIQEEQKFNTKKINIQR